MKRCLPFLLAVVAMACTTPPPSSDRTLYKWIDDEWAFRMKESPLFATYNGDTTQGNKLDTFRPEDIARREKFYGDLLQQISHYDRTSLVAEDRVNFDLFRFYVQDEVDYYTYKSYRIPILADDGFHISFAQLPSSLPFFTEKDYLNYIERLKAFPAYVDQNVHWMKMGLADGFTMPKVVLNGYEVTINSHIVADAEQSVFFKPFKNIPASFTPEAKDKLIAAGKEVILASVVKGYQSFLDFMTKEYIPHCRETIGASALPGGDKYYANRIHYYTTTDMTAEQVHELGLKEVARIKGEMQEVLMQVNFKGDLAAFIKFLRTDPRFYPKTAEELLKEASFIAKKMDNKLPSLFGKLPRQPYGVVPVPEHLAPKYTAGRYSGSPRKSAEAGHYWVNTYNLPSRTLYTLEALTLHEAVPGHHLQIALTQELEELPKFRQQLYVNTFGEGWGLYSEWLGLEAGFYTDPYSNFGRLTYEMWRACRLVVDTGIHTKGWTRQQVIDYLASNTALSLHECTTETDRYISWPGQALAYKIGELKIKELRKKAEHALDEKFDVRAFHDVVLSQGTVTLPILEDMVNEHIQQAQKK
ncbi:DUF885 domain-containing protein [Chryseolinea lacunae]|uniref:DUF885 domain-containing protein n=1 Tax=Chryseolinea lacunae TaxID=2801331 RepID=A0ABS1KN89_9BACT|nr:DUF885 domain-containing protein [Chryseolinea lacunae]MBL0739731.1 DUF885 domain-containing protein [Chryseolinea lacunae]